MNPAPTTHSTSISTFTTSRIAARPRVIPLYATSIPCRAKRPLFIHNNLPSKPYIRARVQEILEITPSASARSESPLTSEGESTDGEDEASNSARPQPRPIQPRPILIPRPLSVKDVKTAPWSEPLVTNYRFIARQAVDLYFDVKKTFLEQAAPMLAKAREHVESAIPQFSAHQRHWGADLLLKDQFKSKKDTLAAKTRREKEKREQEEEEEREKAQQGKQKRKSNTSAYTEKYNRDEAPSAGFMSDLHGAGDNTKKNASVTFNINAFRICTLNGLRCITVPTTSSSPPRYHHTERLPMVEHAFEAWPRIQPWIHDIDVIYRRTRYKVFFQRHKRIPINPMLGIHGELLIMHVGIKNSQNVVHTHSGDKKRAHDLAKRVAPHIACFQIQGRGLKPLIQL
ncbi:hypothetical protein F5050DRAFT_1880372 [Lentinula boryana]|uniref:Uncharacterized protein n=1 Tax=Lentinula boryana TaxID=40481 RepID=A0ABQ8PWU2_9AGAR|nr:hypothetical protein F5050DRAFT_1880372 [Lentinula boryana]